MNLQVEMNRNLLPDVNEYGCQNENHREIDTEITFARIFFLSCEHMSDSEIWQMS